MEKSEIDQIIIAKISELPQEERETAHDDILYLYNRTMNAKPEEQNDINLSRSILMQITEELVNFRLNDLQQAEIVRSCSPTTEERIMVKNKTIIVSKDGDGKKYPKTNEERQMLHQMFKDTFFFSFLNPRQRRNFVECMRPQDIRKDKILIRVGDNGDRLYFIEKGKFCVINNGSEKEIPPYSVFGEISLLHNVPRTATVVARTDGRVWYLKRESYNTIRLFDQENKWSAFVKRMQRLGKNVGELATIANDVFIEEGKHVKLEGKMLVVSFDCFIKIGDQNKHIYPNDIIYDDFVAVSEVEGYTLPRR